VGVGLWRQELVRLWRSRIQAYGIYFIPAGIALLLLALHAWRSHRDLEFVVDARTRALSAAILEKDQLLKEVHHRVKNNMQIISSLIRMQERVETSPDDTIRRVQAMAIVHDLIYTHGEFASVDLAAYTSRLCEGMKSALGAGIRFETRLEPVTVALDRAMPFALILSEVVTNAARHAFPERRGTIAIDLAREGEEIELFVRDDGVGHDHAADARGFGMRLVKSLAVQLGAQVTYERRDGTLFRMSFPVEGPAPMGG
jgi:two-component system, sensor histidine kinase PdtaS